MSGISPYLFRGSLVVKGGDMLKKYEQGFTLLEVLLVVIIMSVVASVAVPTLSSLDAMQLELVSRELQRAFRFARSEAVRTGYSHGVDLVESDTRFRVYKYDTGIDYSVYQPLEKQAYDLYLGTDEQPVKISAKSIKFLSLSLNSQSSISFAAGSGTPVSDSTGSVSLLEYASFELSFNGNIATISIAPITGRVTLQ